MADKAPLISVIVPIYNVAPYLRKCLDSLKNQTLKQIEVICIDDGSTDGSGEIAEEYKNDGGWPVFRVIHTVNRGLSAARNRGIDESRAERIMFVDSDDWVEPGFCEIPYAAAIEKQVEIVIFEYDHYKRGRTQKYTRKDIQTGIIDEFSAHEHSRVTWNKLYSINLYNNISFPVNRVYEDIATTHRVVHLAKRIILLSDCLYHHTIRKSSISHTKKTYREDWINSEFTRYNDLISYGYPVEKMNEYMCSVALLVLANPGIANDMQYQKSKEIIDSTHNIPQMIGIKKGIVFVLWKYNAKLLKLLTRVVGYRV